MNGLMRNLLVISLAAVGSMPMQAKAESGGSCADHCGIESASARPAGRGFDVRVRCFDGTAASPSTRTAATRTGTSSRRATSSPPHAGTGFTAKSLLIYRPRSDGGSDRSRLQ